MGKPVQAQAAAVARRAARQRVHLLEERPRARQPAVDDVVDLGRDVEGHVRQLEGVRRGRGTVALGLELLPRLREVVVHLEVGVARVLDDRGLLGGRLAGRVDGAPVDGRGVVDAHAQRARGPDDGLGQDLGGAHAGHVHAELAVGLRDEAAGRRAVAPVAELLARDEHLLGVGEARQDVAERLVVLRHEELVDVDVGQPLGRRAEEAHDVVVGVALQAAHGEVDGRHDAVVGVRLEHVVEVVGAAVVVEEEVVDADGQVVAEPLLHVRRLVLEDGHDGDVEAAALGERHASRGPRRAAPAAATTVPAAPGRPAQRRRHPVPQPHRASLARRDGEEVEESRPAARR